MRRHCCQCIATAAVEAAVKNSRATRQAGRGSQVRECISQSGRVAGSGAGLPLLPGRQQAKGHHRSHVRPSSRVLRARRWQLRASQ